jgi:hypothetical protein
MWKADEIDNIVHINYIKSYCLCESHFWNVQKHAIKHMDETWLHEWSWPHLIHYWEIQPLGRKFNNMDGGHYHP